MSAAVDRRAFAKLVDRAKQVDAFEVARRFVQLKRVTAVEQAGPCPHCGGVDRFRINIKNGLWHCRGCDERGDVIALEMLATGETFIEAVEALTGESTETREPRKPAPKPKEKERNAFVERMVADLVREAVPVRGTPGEVYLRENRQIDTDAIADVLERTDALGWHPAVYFNEPGDPERGDPPHPLHGRKLGCIIGIMTDPVTAAPTGAISRTYLGPDGTKVGKAKTLASPAGVVRLSLDEDVLEGLHLAEEVETGLCAMSLGFRPLWATGSTSPMRVFPVLSGIEAVTFLADRDGNGAGEDAATAAARRWRAAGREARIKRLSEGLGDINDAVMESR